MDKCVAYQSFASKMNGEKISSSQIEAFNEIKNLITKAPVLSFYDPDKAVELQVDSSSVGVGACLLQGGRPVSYASATLTQTQRRWSQIEKECFAILFACKKFHCYLYGQQITVTSDHKPLIPIFKKPLANVTPRLTRILLSLQNYNLNVQWKPGKDMKLADFLSRAYLQDTYAYSGDVDNANVEVYEFVKELPISKKWYSLIKLETEKDSVLSQVKTSIETDNWYKNDHRQDRQFNGFFNIRNDLFIEDDILFFDKRIVIPTLLREQILKMLHESHFGIEKTRTRARQIVYWPGMNADIENYIKSCSKCAEYQYANPKEMLKKHEIILRPWAKIAMDLFSYGMNKYLIVIDYYSRYFEYFNVGKYSGAKTIIKCLKDIFSRLGIPDLCISDNGPPFQSHELDCFARDYGFDLNNSAPLLANSNGLVEKGVSIAKSILRKSDDPFISLMEYRNIRLIGIGKSPNELMFNDRIMKCKLPICNRLLNSNKNSESKDQLDLAGKFRQLAKQQEKYYNRTAHNLPELAVGDSIRYKKKADSRTWDTAQLIKRLDERNYLIKNMKGNELVRNRKHLLKTEESGKEAPDFERDCDGGNNMSTPSLPVSASRAPLPDLSDRGQADNCLITPSETNPAPRRSLRDRDKINKPDRLTYDRNFKQIAIASFSC